MVWGKSDCLGKERQEREVWGLWRVCRSKKVGMGGTRRAGSIQILANYLGSEEPSLKPSGQREYLLSTDKNLWKVRTLWTPL